MEHATKYFVADLVEEVGSLPSVAAQVVALTSDPTCEMNHLERIIHSDGVMSMRFLALANKASFSRGQEIRDLRGALVRLGLRRVRNVALCMGMHDLLPSGSGDGPLRMDDFWRYSLATASCAQELARRRGSISGEDAWLVGILHGIGIAALDQKLGDEFRRALQEADATGAPLASAELSILDFHHGELGGRILKAWNLPQVFVAVVAAYPDEDAPAEATEEVRLQIATLRAAIATVRAIGFGHNGDGTPALSVKDLCLQLDLDEAALTELASEIDNEVANLSRLVGLDTPEGAVNQALEASKRQVARLGLEGFDESVARQDLEDQLSMARDIQQRLLPEAMPEIPGCQVAALNRPSLHVSGDYYDFLTLPDGATGLVVADVAGKGMPASLLASNLQASLRALSGVVGDPGDLLAAANTSLLDGTDPELFATLFLAAIDADGRRLTYASAGHNPPLLLHADGSLDWLKPAGTPLGLFPAAKYPVTPVDLSPGDLLVIYTDGVTEAADPTGAEFSAAGLEAVVRKNTTAKPTDLVACIANAVINHVNTQGEASVTDRLVSVANEPSLLLDDDLTLIVLVVP